MKILIIHTAYQLKGGEDTVVDAEFQLLRHAGHDVELLHFTNEGNVLPKLLQLPFNVSSYIRTRKMLKAFEPDIVHVHNLHFAASPSVFYAVKRTGVPLVCTLHNFRLICPSGTLFHEGRLFLHALNGRFPWKAIKAGVFKNSRTLTCWIALSMWIHRWLGTWRMPNRLIVLNRHAKQLFLSSGLRFRKGQLITKSNFSMMPASAGIRRGDRFLFAGRLSPEKGVMVLLKAFAETGRKITLAGDGPLRPVVEDYARMYRNIHYAGPVHRQELLALMQQSVALVFPSTWFEGMPMTIIEAFSCGLPVIASKLGAMECMISDRHNGFLFEPGNEEALAEAIEKWQALSSAEKHAMSSHAMATYKKWYTPEKNLEELIHIYASVQKEFLPQAFGLAG